MIGMKFLEEEGSSSALQMDLDILSECSVL
jgi:hypothetical protein